MTTFDYNQPISQLREIREKAYIAMKADPNNTALEDAWLLAGDNVIKHDNYWHNKFKNTLDQISEVPPTDDSFCNIIEPCGECNKCSVYCDVCGIWYDNEEPCEFH